MTKIHTSMEIHEASNWLSLICNSMDSGWASVELIHVITTELFGSN